MQAASQSIALMQRSSAEFFRQSGCVACHHQPATAMALASARPRNGRSIAAWLGCLNGRHAAEDSSRRRIGSPRQSVVGCIGCGLSTRCQHGCRSRRCRRTPTADGLIGRAAFAIRAIQLFGWQGRRADFDRSIDHARTFLALAKPTTGDDRAMLVLGLAWSGASKPLLEKALQNLIAHQRPDGGWGGNDNLPSHPSPPPRSRLPPQKSI